MKRQIIIVMCLVGLLGWFGVQVVQAQDHGSVMQDSGFQKWNVDTPKEKAFFDKCPEDKFITYKKANNIVHVYKDPQTGVIYAGDQDALQGYLQKTKNQGMTAKPQEDAEEASDPDFWLNWATEHGAGP